MIINCINCVETGSCIDFSANLVTIIGFPLAILSVIIAASQIYQNKKVEKARLLLELEKMFQTYEDIDRKLKPNGEWIGKEEFDEDDVKDLTRLDDYLGLFEVCETMIESNLLDIANCKNFYEYRLYNIKENKAVVSRIKVEIEDWKKLIKVIKRFHPDFDINL